jgi:lysophospholipid acyltransferase (LPLAT)-like uncharacterized protein
LKAAPPVGAAYLRFVNLTGRYRVTGEEHLQWIRREHGQALWVVWHNRLLGAIAMHGNENIGAVISKSKDGELIARAVERLGYTPLRGSTSRGQTGALKGLLRHVSKGFDVVVTPDGPRGPRYRVQPGAAWIAMKTGFPILPVGVGASPKVVFKSWDRFQLPLPFGRVSVVYGKPLLFGKDEPVEEVREKIAAALTLATDEADRMLGTVSP